MPIILPQVDYSPLYRAIGLKAGAESAFIGTKSLDVMSRIRGLEERQRSAEKRWGRTQTILGVAELLLQAGQTVYGIFEQRNFEAAKADLHGLQQEMTGKIRTYIDNNQFTWSTDSEGNKTMKMPPEFDQWYQKSLSEIEEQHKSFPRVQSWLKDQMYQMYDQSTETALNYGRAYAAKQTLTEFNRNIENAMTDALAIGNFAPVEGVINSARNWLGDPAADNLLAKSRQEYELQLQNRQVQIVTQGALGILEDTRNPEKVEGWISENTPFWDDTPEKRQEIVDEVWRQWAVHQDRQNVLKQEAAEKIYLDYLDRFQKGDPPTWNDIRGSALSLREKEHFLGVLNSMAEDAREQEEARIKDYEKQREEAENLEAFDRAYAELIDFPLNREEEWEDRVMGDPLLTGGKGGQKEWLISEYRQRSREDRAAAGKESPLEVTDDSTLSELIRIFYDFEKYSNNEVESYIKDHHGKGLSNIDTRTWLERVKKRDTYRSRQIVLDMVSQYYDDLLKEETNKATILEERKKEASIRIQLDDAIKSGEYTDKGLYELAVNLIVENKEGRVNRKLRGLVTEEPELKEISPTEDYQRKLTEQFTKWKGEAPVDTDILYGEPVFFDGTYWYVYRRLEGPGEFQPRWHYWDGEKWVIATE